MHTGVMVGTVDLGNDVVNGRGVASQTNGGEHHWFGRTGKQLGGSEGWYFTMKGGEVRLDKFWLSPGNSAGPLLATILGKLNLEGSRDGSSGEVRGRRRGRRTPMSHRRRRWRRLRRGRLLSLRFLHRSRLVTTV